MIVFNFRADRVVQISKALEYHKFSKFERKRFPKVFNFTLEQSAAVMAV